MNQHEVGRYADAALRAATRGADGWPAAWCEGVWNAHYSNGRSAHEGTAYFDRDRCTLDRARAIARDVEAKFRREHARLDPLVLHVVPTTRTAIALACVREHFDEVVQRDAHKLTRGGEPWVFVSDVTVKVGWTVGDDRVVVELVADSSADEGNARTLGLAWLAELVAKLPELGGVVDVIGSSH